MSKLKKLAQARIHARWVMDRCTIGNPHAMTGGTEELSETAKKGMTSAIGNALVGFKLGLKSAKGDTTAVTSMGKLDNEGWLRIGHNFLMQMESGKIPSLVCDTCAATMAAMLSRDPMFKGVKVEMVRCGFNVHHFLAVNRAEGDINSLMAWGDKAFVIDIWDDKLDPSTDLDKVDGVFDRPSLSSLVVDYMGKLVVTQTFVL